MPLGSLGGHSTVTVEWVATLGPMRDERKLLTALELDEMSPDERAAAVNDRVVTDLDELPAEFRDRVVATGRRLAVERAQTDE
jgi:hypothetical protein